MDIEKGTKAEKTGKETEGNQWIGTQRALEKDKIQGIKQGWIQRKEQKQKNRERNERIGQEMS